MTDSEKLARILALCERMADQLNEHSVELKFLHSQVDVHSEDVTTMASQLRDVRHSVDQLTKITEGHSAQIRDHRKSIHELRDDEERRAASGNSEQR